jgi:alpha-glucosidase
LEVTNLNNYNFFSELNKDAVFSDESENFRSPSKPKKDDKVTIKIRTAENDADYVFVVTDKEKILTEKKLTQNGFDYYYVTILNFEKEFNYYFEISRNGEIYYYSKIGISHYRSECVCFKIIRDFNTPSWADGCVMYQVYIDRFRNGDKSNNVKTGEYMYLGYQVSFKNDWYRFPSADDVRNFYGGDIQGVWDKLEYIKNLGIDVLYFNPVFVSPSNHKYDTQDYEHIDPHIGKAVNLTGHILDKSEHTNENAELYIKMTTDEENLKASDKFFAEFIKAAHAMGIKVILDGVFNHCGSFNKWLDREKIYAKSGYPVGAYWSRESPYKDFFIWGNENGWPENGSYESWWNFSNHPKLSYETSPKLLEKIMDIGCKWLKEPYSADGWRIDVGADLGKSAEFNHKFWKYFRKRVKEANKNAVIIAEHYGDASPWLKGDEWDTVMNYDAFMEPVSYFFTGMEKHSDSFNSELYNSGKVFEDTMIKNMSKIPYQSLICSMNQLSNHDHSRFLTRTNMTVGRVANAGSESASEGINKDIMKEAVLFQMTWPGIPAIYYGDEAGLCGWTDPDNRRTYPWGREDTNLIKFHKMAINLRKEHLAFKNGSVMFLNCGSGFISYGRFDKKEKFIVVFNNNDFQCKIIVPVWKLEIPDKDKLGIIFKTDESQADVIFNVENGNIKIVLNKRSGAVIGYKKKL